MQMEEAIAEDAAMFAQACAPEVKIIQEKRIFIGSGEDVCLDII